MINFCMCAYANKGLGWVGCVLVFVMKGRFSLMRKSVAEVSGGMDFFDSASSSTERYQMHREKRRKRQTRNERHESEVSCMENKNLSA